MASAPQDLSEVYLLEKRKGEIEEVNIIPNGSISSPSSSYDMIK